MQLEQNLNSQFPPVIMNSFVATGNTGPLMSDDANDQGESSNPEDTDSGTAVAASNEDRQWHAVTYRKPTRFSAPQPSNHLHPLLSSRVLKDLIHLLERQLQYKRMAVLTAFVRQLHIDTTEDYLTKYLIDGVMKGVVCKKMQPKDVHTFKTAAFRMSCLAENKGHFLTMKATGLKELNYVTGSFISRHG